MKGLIVLRSGQEELILEGTLFGALRSADAENVVFGEFVFNTSMTGYQEILTDPSYAGQIVCFTTPHIGNTGANREDLESTRIHAEALVIARYTPRPSNFRSEETLEEFLVRNKKSGIHGVDTRRLTLFLRDCGVASGMILPAALRDSIPAQWGRFESAGYDKIDWIRQVTTREVRVHEPAPHDPSPRFHVVAYDFGIKAQLLRDLSRRGCKVTVVPADFPASEVERLRPDGVFLSNGPGDPKLATYAVQNVKLLLGKQPVFGVCMGHQVLALALGGNTYKLKFGHRGANQPVLDLERSSVEISSHNHGYAVDASSLPARVKLTHVNTNDQCCEGISVPDQMAFSVQYHPESSPGPHDSGHLFDRFVHMMDDFVRHKYI